jgi:mRNA interferase RelE/StbE
VVQYAEAFREEGPIVGFWSRRRPAGCPRGLGGTRWLGKGAVKGGLKKRLVMPRVAGSELRAPLVDCYKIKLRGVGYRLVYLVRDNENSPDIVVLAVGRRDGGIYEDAAAVREEGLDREVDDS